MAKNQPIYIPIVTLEELAKPYPLEEVLVDLIDEGFIDKFKIGQDLVRIETSTQKRFEIATLMTEDYELNLSGRKAKKSSN